MVRRVWLAIALCSLLSSGCVRDVGNLAIADTTKENLSAQFVKGRTNTEEVRKAMGEPAKIVYADNGTQTWDYVFSRMRSKPANHIPIVNMFGGGAEGERKTVTLLFDRNKILQQSSIDSTPVDINQNLIDALKADFSR